MSASRAENKFERLERQYKLRYDRALVPLCGRLDGYLRDVLKDYPRLDRVSVRPKTVDRFVEKAQRLESGVRKYADPLNQIQDQLGARLVTFYLSDVAQVSAIVEEFFGPIEVKQVVPDSASEFGYEGKHYILFIPKDVMIASLETEGPIFFELQIKTLFQHAWGEADHDLAYKSPVTLTTDQKRRVAFTAAQAWGADRMFEDLAQELTNTAGTKAKRLAMGKQG